MGSIYEMRTIVGALAIRQDFQGGNKLIFLGESEPGVATSLGAWRIRKFTYDGNKLISVEWADGNGNFDNVYDDRATLSYS